MNIALQRLGYNEVRTQGVLYINGKMVGFTLEDTKRNVKIKGETRIPAGRYLVTLRTEGGMHPKYKAKYPFHKGMLWLRNVPLFEYIYIHTGNNDDHTAGCLLVGLTADMDDNLISDSVKAYGQIYPIIAEAIEKGETVYIHVIDELIYT